MVMSALALHQQSRGLAALGIPVTGLNWSVGIWLARVEEIRAIGVAPLESFVLVALGGLSQTLALWVGFCAVCWAMVRLLRAQVRLTSLMVITSRASLPLWFGAFAAAFLFYGAKTQTLVAGGIFLASFMAFLVLTSIALARELKWRMKQAAYAIGATVAFLVSFVSLLS